MFSCFSQANEQFVRVDPFIHHQNNSLRRTGGKRLISHSKPARCFGVGGEKHRVCSNLDFTALEDWERNCPRRELSRQRFLKGKPASPALPGLGFSFPSAPGLILSCRAVAGVSVGQRQRPSRAQAGARGCTLVLRGPFAALLASLARVFLLRQSRAGQGLSAGVRVGSPGTLQTKISSVKPDNGPQTSLEPSAGILRAFHLVQALHPCPCRQQLFRTDHSELWR